MKKKAIKDNFLIFSYPQNSEEDSDEINDFAYCFKFCTIPQAVDFAQSNSEVNYCTNGADAGCVLEIIQANRKYFIDRMDGPNSTTMCPHPCYDIDYSYSKTINSIPSSRHGETWYFTILITICKKAFIHLFLFF